MSVPVPGIASSEPARSKQHGALEVESLWKVFGPGRALDGMERARRGATRAEVLAETGQTIGVRDVSFRVDRGETFVVMGLSGSGKSSLVRCIARLNEPTSGRVLLDGDDLTAMDAGALRAVRRTRMSMVFQHFGLFPHRRVIDNVAYGLEVRGVAKSERRTRAHEVLETVGLQPWAGHYPQQLSGGMQQRVGLARALALDPSLLFFDEPFSALDPLIRRDMQTELLRLQSIKPRTIVFITHDFAEALRLGERIAIMKDGSFDQIGTPEEIVAAPATAYVREFTNDIPKARVLSARSVMRLVAADEDVSNAPAVESTTKVGALVPLMLDGHMRLRVVADGRDVGVVERETIARLLGDEWR